MALLYIEDDRTNMHTMYLYSLQAHCKGSLYMSQAEHYVSRLTLAPAVGELSHQKEFEETSLKVTVCKSRPNRQLWHYCR